MCIATTHLQNHGLGEPSTVALRSSVGKILATPLREVALDTAVDASVAAHSSSMLVASRLSNSSTCRAIVAQSVHTDQL